MIEMASRDPKNGATRVGGQPIALAASALVVIVVGASAMALWRSHASTAREQDRPVATIPLQVNTAQVTDELSEKTRALETTQQESIDQLQTLQDQLQTAKQLLAAQQEDTRRLSAQVSSLTEAIDSLRQSFASARAAEASAPSTRRESAPARSDSSKNADRKRAH
jgi:flagellar motility protein MotE (MotC chaperone)